VGARVESVRAIDHAEERPPIDASPQAQAAVTPTRRLRIGWSSHDQAHTEYDPTESEHSDTHVAWRADDDAARGAGDRICRAARANRRDGSRENRRLDGRR